MPEASSAPVADLLESAVQALGGSRRDGQVAMVEAVEQAIADKRHALIQAGTGTGKSVGYLVPAVAHAVRDGGKVLVSTATLALQRQIYTKDLPLVSEALSGDMGAKPRVALLKGRGNYICRHKLGGGYPEADDILPIDTGPTSPLGKDIARLHRWADETDTGDRDDLVPGVSNKAWAQVSVGGRECLGPKCPMASDCFAEDARAAVREADIVITNHAMLGIEASSPGQDIIPPHDTLIVDEAHELVSRITSSATLEITEARLDAAARAARRCGVITANLDDATNGFGRALDECEAGRLRGGLGEDLAGVIVRVRDATRNVLSSLKAVSESGDSQAQMAKARLTEIFDMTSAIVEDAETLVLWLAPADGEWSSTRVSRLLAAPLDVASLVRASLTHEKAVVFTSATLALGGNFDSMAAALGVSNPMTLDAGSPFDYEKQGILYVADHLERPGTGGISDAALDELASLIEAAGGRTLGLFSSHRAGEAAAEAMRERFDFPIYYQTDDQVSTLVELYRNEDRACLFGSTTLWQGIDIPGVTSQLVVIDRIPFPRPDDPVAQARTEAVAARGGNGFMAVSAAHAALLLAQGAGRLIRAVDDRGVVAVLDSRLSQARYASFLTKSMPRLWPTTDPEVAYKALRNLDASAKERSQK